MRKNDEQKVNKQKKEKVKKEKTKKRPRIEIILASRSFFQYFLSLLPDS